METISIQLREAKYLGYQEKPTDRITKNETPLLMSIWVTKKGDKYVMPNGVEMQIGDIVELHSKPTFKKTDNDKWLPRKYSAQTDWFICADAKFYSSNWLPEGRYAAQVLVPVGSTIVDGEFGDKLPTATIQLLSVDDK